MTLLSLDHSALDMRRGACPALSAPMMTGDGLLARIALTEAISPAELAALCRLARRHGNGMIDISARGNLQVRGLTENTAPLLDDDVRALNLPLREDLAVEVPPLAGLDNTEIADPRPLAEAIREGARTIKGLAPKMSVIVDGHGPVRLSSLLADIRLVATKTDKEITWRLLLGGTEKTGRVFNVLRETQAAEVALELLRKLSQLGPGARGRDLAGGLPSYDDTDFSSSEPTTHTPTSPFDLFTLSNGQHGIGIGPAFGQVAAADLITLCDEATRLAIKSVKPALDHSLLFFGYENDCRSLQDFASENDFITSATDPRGTIAACPGSPACRSATIVTHDVAAKAAADCGDLLDGSFKLHVSGCTKGCAHPAVSALTLCGTQAGLSLVAQGKSADLPFAAIDFADTNATLRRLADLVRSEKHAGENSAACLARLGAQRLATAATSGRP